MAGCSRAQTDAVKELKTSAAKFLIPTEIATNRDDVARYAKCWNLREERVRPSEIHSALPR